jgi:glycosyltransferase involved in cell wall biosynthesis
MSEKIISIIIPCYNVEQYIDRCFESLKNQTLGLDKMELIFINDASTDGTLEKLTEYEKQYPESILVINFEENQRQGTARNVALEYVSAPYVGYVDSDDWAEPAMFEKMVSLIQQYDCDFVECGWDYAKDFHNRKSTKRWGTPGYMDLTKPEVKREFVRTKVALVSLWDKVFKKSFLVDNDIYCPERILNEDIFFVYLAFTYATSYYYTDEVLYHYFVNEKGTMRQKKADYQFDKMTVSLGFLQECKNRGLYVDNPANELERLNKETIGWMFLERYYVYMLWEVFEVFPERSYEVYQEMKQTILQWLPDYKTNSFRKLSGNEFDDVMLKLLDYDMSEQQLCQLRNQMLDKFGATDAQDF